MDLNKLYILNTNHGPSTKQVQMVSLDVCFCIRHVIHLQLARCYVLFQRHFGEMWQSQQVARRAPSRPDVSSARQMARSLPNIHPYKSQHAIYLEPPDQIKHRIPKRDCEVNSCLQICNETVRPCCASWRATTTMGASVPIHTAHGCSKEIMAENSGNTWNNQRNN